MNDDDDELVEQIVEEGKVVFSHDWDSGDPGAGAGAEEVYRWKGKFAVCSLDFGNSGPFATLDEALREQSLLTVNSATTGIDCKLITAEELIKRLECEEDSCAIDINGEPWVGKAQGAKFVWMRAAQ